MTKHPLDSVIMGINLKQQCWIEFDPRNLEEKDAIGKIKVEHSLEDQLNRVTNSQKNVISKIGTWKDFPKYVQNGSWRQLGIKRKKFLKYYTCYL